MNTKSLWFLAVFLIFIIGCQKEEVINDKQTLEKMAAMNIITYDSDKVSVVIDELSFLPPFIHIKKGATVTWENRDKAEHTVAWHNRKAPTEIIESDVLKTGDAYTYIFKEDGVYDYICGIHPFMHGGIIVGNPPELSAMMEFANDTPSPKVFSITPSKVSVNGGGKVIVKGDNFVKDATVFFHHLFGDVKFIDSKTLEVITPKHYALKMDVIVTNPDGDHFTFPNSFEFFGEEVQQPETIKFDYEEKKTPHFTGSMPKHGSSLSSPSTISISFNYPIAKGSNIILYDLNRNKLAEGNLKSNRLGLIISPVPKLGKGTYKVAYHAIWLGGSAHDGEFYFNIPPEQKTAEATEKAAGSGRVISVVIKGFKFVPADLNVKVGDTIVWTNEDSAPHTVESSDGVLKSDELSKGDTYKYTFTKAEKYNYICGIHPYMKGTVTVQ